jgi:transposase
MADRLAAVGDLWADLLTSGQSLRPAIEQLGEWSG